MPFTTAQLAAQVNNPQLSLWAGTNPGNQAPFLTAYTNYFNGLQNWITANGGANPFGWNNVAGLTRLNGVQVVLLGPAQRAPLNDAFEDVRAHLETPNFRLFQAAQADQRLIGALGHLG